MIRNSQTREVKDHNHPINIYQKVLKPFSERYCWEEDDFSIEIVEWTFSNFKGTKYPFIKVSVENSHSVFLFIYLFIFLQYTDKRDKKLSKITLEYVILCKLLQTK